MITELTFYTTDGCHLCEEAKQLLQQLLSDYPEQYQIEIIDIVEAESLIQQYGTRIPVVKRNSSVSDLGWPFDYEGLLEFVGEHNG
jgi:glutaredoxin